MCDCYLGCGFVGYLGQVGILYVGFGVLKCVEVVGGQCCDGFCVDYYVGLFNDFEYLCDVVVYFVDQLVFGGDVVLVECQFIGC